MTEAEVQARIDRDRQRFETWWEVHGKDLDGTSEFFYVKSLVYAAYIQGGIDAVTDAIAGGVIRSLSQPSNEDNPIDEFSRLTPK